MVQSQTKPPALNLEKEISGNPALLIPKDGSYRKENQNADIHAFYQLGGKQIWTLEERNLRQFEGHFDLIVVAGSPNDSPTFETFFERINFFEKKASGKNVLFLIDLPPFLTKKGPEASLPDFSKIDAPHCVLLHPRVRLGSVSVSAACVLAARLQRLDRILGIYSFPLQGEGWKTILNPEHLEPIQDFFPYEVEEWLKSRVNLICRGAQKNSLRLRGARTLAQNFEQNRRFFPLLRAELALQQELTRICEPFLFGPLHPRTPEKVELAITALFQNLKGIFDSNMDPAYFVKSALVSHHRENHLTVHCDVRLPLLPKNLPLEFAWAL